MHLLLKLAWRLFCTNNKQFAPQHGIDKYTQVYVTISASNYYAIAMPTSHNNIP